jgi:hypothetical protein
MNHALRITAFIFTILISFTLGYLIDLGKRSSIDKNIFELKIISSKKDKNISELKHNLKHYKQEVEALKIINEQLASLVDQAMPELEARAAVIDDLVAKIRELESK